MTLPAPLREAAAVCDAERYARDWVNQCLDQNWLGALSNGSMLAPGAGELAWRRFLKVWALQHPFNFDSLMREARADDVDSNLVMDELVAEGAAELLPSWTKSQLASWVIETKNPTTPSRPPGPRRTSHILQDICAAVLVDELVRRFGVKATGNSPRRVSACAIVAKTFTAHRDRVGRGVMTPAQIKKIYQRYLPELGKPSFLNRLSWEKLPRYLFP